MLHLLIWKTPTHINNLYSDYGVWEVSFSQPLQFCEKCGFLHAAQFAYRKGLGCNDPLITISHHLQMSLDAGMEYYIVQLDFSAAFSREWVPVICYSNWHLLVHVAVCCPFVESSSPTEGRESWLMVLRVSGFQSFQACLREVCWVLFSLSHIPAKCLSCFRTDYLLMHMTPHCWQLFVS